MPKRRTIKTKYQTVVKKVTRPQNFDCQVPLHYQPPPPPPTPPFRPSRSPSPVIELDESAGVVENFLARSQKAGKAKWTGHVNNQNRKMEFGQVVLGLSDFLVENTEGRDAGGGSSAGSGIKSAPALTRKDADVLLNGVQDDLIYTVQCWATECTEMNARMQHLEEIGDTLTIQKLRTLISVLRVVTQVTNLLAENNCLESDWDRGEDIKEKAKYFKDKTREFLELVRCVNEAVEGIRMASQRIVNWIKDSEALFSKAFGALYPDSNQTVIPNTDVEILVNRTKALKKHFERIENHKDQAMLDAKLAAKIIQICYQIQVPKARFAVEALLLLPDCIINLFKLLRSPRMLLRIDEINLLLEKDQKEESVVAEESTNCSEKKQAPAILEEMVARLSIEEKKLFYQHGYPERVGLQLKKV